MVGELGGRSQPANTTIAGGVHMVVSVSDQYERNRACRLIISMPWSQTPARSG